jgi:aryl sulfotransferase
MICALLVFQSVDLPGPLDLLSPWVDMLTHSYEDLMANLEAQQHRRFLKSHTPLDGLPFGDRITYICVGRDPRDVAISWDNQRQNTDMKKMVALRKAAAGLDDMAKVMPSGVPKPPESQRDRFWAWAEGSSPFPGLSELFHHLSTFWSMRDRPNVVLLHYDDLRNDLEGQMRGLAGRLGIQISEQVWPDLVQAATFTDMRQRTKELVPEITAWHDPERFFHRGTSGQWRNLLNDDDLRRYQARVSELADPELSAWIHKGPIRS